MLTTANYLDLIGITQWHPRSEVNPQSQWLFILEKQELIQHQSLLEAILKSINQTINSVTLVYLDNTNTTIQLPSDLRYIVAMGELPAQLLQTNTDFPEKIPVIISANLTTLATDPTAKRALWQQLKQHQT